MRWMLGLVAVVAMTGGASAESASVKRGSYLANTIMTCANCHSPKGPPEATNGKDYSGGLEFDEPPFKVTAPNITQDKETGLGKWSAAEIKNVLLTGIRPNGTPLAEIMPTNFYQILTPSDANAIVAYLKTLKPISNKVPNPLYKMALPHHLFPGSEKPMPASAMRNKIKRGFYLATIGHCMECHTDSAVAASSSRARGACRSRATSRRARPRASASGPTRRSNARSRKACPRTAASLSRRWVTVTTRA